MSDDLKPILEALIFASPDPLTPAALFELLDETPREAIEEGLAALQAEYDERDGLQMVQVAGGYQICTRPDLHEWVRRLFHQHSKQRLSVQALETLAVIAYKQPITTAEIAEIRGVNASGVVGTLLDRHLVKVVGRKQVVGRPFLYATTMEFLNQFGLSDLGDLPKVEEMAEALGMEVPPGLAADDSQDEAGPAAAGDSQDGPGPLADESEVPPGLAADDSQDPPVSAVGEPQAALAAGDLQQPPGPAAGEPQNLPGLGDDPAEPPGDPGGPPSGQVQQG